MLTARCVRPARPDMITPHRLRARVLTRSAILCLSLLVCATSGAAVLDGVPLGGMVSDLGGAGLAGVVVVLSPESAPAEVRTATTLEDGRYAFEPLQAGVYRLMAVKSGYTTAVSRIDTALSATLDFVLKPRAPRDPALAED